MAVPEIPNIRKKGLKSAYAPNGEHKDVIYFATDTGELLLNNVPYANDIPEGGSEGQILMYAGPRQVKWATIEGSDAVTENTYAYGVEWTKNQSSPILTRIGNLSLHKTLPIQSKLKGCVATVDGQIKYWLRYNNWFLKETKEDNITVDSPEFASSNDLTKINIPEITNKGYCVGTGVTLIDSSNNFKATGFIKSVSEKQLAGGKKQLTIEWIKNNATSDFFTNGGTMVLGSNLTGKDGVVKVYVPEFYIKSKNIGNKKQVLISEKKIDSSWEKQPACLVDAYHCTLWRGEPNSESDFYTDGLETNTLVSVSHNFQESYKGGVYNGDSTGNTHPISDSCYAKPITGLSRENARTYAQNQRAEGGNGHLLTYKEWKNIFYWLYVIEYANFNVKDVYSADIDGYKAGGLFRNYTIDSFTALTTKFSMPEIFAQCGSTDIFANTSCSSKLTFSVDDVSYTLPINRYRGFEDICMEFGTMLDGIVINGTNADSTFNIYINDSSDQSANSDDVTQLTLLGAQSGGEASIKEFTLGDTAELLPLDADSSATVTTHKCSLFTADDFGPSANKYGIYVQGGCKNIGNDTGLATMDCTTDITDPDVWSYGFRTVVNIDPIENV